MCCDRPALKQDICEQVLLFFQSFALSRGTQAQVSQHRQSYRQENAWLTSSRSCYDQRWGRAVQAQMPCDLTMILFRLTLKLKLQYFGHLMQRADSLEKIPMLGKIEGRRRRRQQRMRCLDGITNLMNISLASSTKLVMDRGVWHAAIHGVARIRHN